jgi:hypothetical protein
MTDRLRQRETGSARSIVPLSGALPCEPRRQHTITDCFTSDAPIHFPSRSHMECRARRARREAVHMALSTIVGLTQRKNYDGYIRHLVLCATISSLDDLPS